MFRKRKRGLFLLFVSLIMLCSVACGRNTVGNTEHAQETEDKIEIKEANDILTAVWSEFEPIDTDGNPYNDRFDVMGGHFDTAVMNMPAIYDLTNTDTLEQIYCVPTSSIDEIDDAATIVHLMKAHIFTVGAYHVVEENDVRTVVEEIQTQTRENQWLGGFPERHFIAIIDKEYVVSVFGTEGLVNNFKDILLRCFGKRASVQVDERIH